VFQQFRQAKFAYGGSILSSSKFSLLTQLALKKTLATKVVKINSLPGSKSVKQTVPVKYIDYTILGLYT
jgi:hypothetical protein